MHFRSRPLLTLFGALAFASSADAQTNWVLNPNWFMREGGFLRIGEYIQSQNHAFYLAMSMEGHLSLYNGSSPTAN